MESIPAQQPVVDRTPFTESKTYKSLRIAVPALLNLGTSYYMYHNPVKGTLLTLGTLAAAGLLAGAGDRLWQDRQTTAKATVIGLGIIGVMTTGFTTAAAYILLRESGRNVVRLNGPDAMIYFGIAAAAIGWGVEQGLRIQRRAETLQLSPEFRAPEGIVDRLILLSADIARNNSLWKRTVLGFTKVIAIAEPRFSNYLPTQICRVTMVTKSTAERDQHYLDLLTQYVQIFAHLDSNAKAAVRQELPKIFGMLSESSQDRFVTEHPQFTWDVLRNSEAVENALNRETRRIGALVDTALEGKDDWVERLAAIRARADANEDLEARYHDFAKLRADVTKVSELLKSFYLISGQEWTEEDEHIRDFDQNLISGANGLFDKLLAAHNRTAAVADAATQDTEETTDFLYSKVVRETPNWFSSPADMQDWIRETLGIGETVTGAEFGNAFDAKLSALGLATVGDLKRANILPEDGSFNKVTFATRLKEYEAVRTSDAASLYSRLSGGVHGAFSLFTSERANQVTRLVYKVASPVFVLTTLTFAPRTAAVTFGASIVVLGFRRYCPSLPAGLKEKIQRIWNRVSQSWITLALVAALLPSIVRAKMLNAMRRVTVDTDYTREQRQAFVNADIFGRARILAFEAMATVSLGYLRPPINVNNGTPAQREMVDYIMPRIGVITQAIGLADEALDLIEGVWTRVRRAA